MKIILIDDVANLGQAGDIKTVANGYARNYLIPRGLARQATASVINQLDQIRQAALKRSALRLENAKALAAQLSEMTVTFTALAGEGTRLYGSVTSSDIGEKLSEILGIEFDRRKIQLDAPLRQLGSHQVPIRLASEVIPELTVVIERKGGEEAVEEEVAEEAVVEEVVAEETTVEETAE